MLPGRLETQLASRLERGIGTESGRDASGMPVASRWGEVLWNIYQQLQIENLRAQQRLTSARVDLHSARQGRRVDDAADDVMRLVLILQAMFELMGERLGITQEELMARIHEIDGRDGTVDGRVTPAPRDCPACQTKVPVDRETCQFCGTAVAGRDLFAG